MAKRAILVLLLEAVLVSAAVFGYAMNESSSVRAAASIAGVAADRPAATPTTRATPTPAPTPAPTPTPSPDPTASPTPTSTPDPLAITNTAPLPKCADGSRQTLLMAYDQWSRVLVDKTLSIPKDYVPPDLVSVRQAGFSGTNQVRAVMIDDLRSMRVAARAAGAKLDVFSSYRSYAEQVWTFGHWVNALGPEAAVMSSARAGHSEHQLGLAIDFREVGGPKPWAYSDWARMTIGGQWLAKNAWQFGFIESYPLGKTNQVCYGYEPWHYRYVGREAAARIHGSGETLRLWLWQHQPEQYVAPTPTPSPTPIWTFGPKSN